MKKTLQTVMTAAMFAAAVNVIPSGNVTTTAYDPALEEFQDVYGPPVLTTTAAETITTTDPVGVYGPPIAWTTTTIPVETMTTTESIPVAVYGPPIAWVGDVDDDGKIDVFDMIELKNAYLNGIPESSWSYLYRADINKDGAIGVADLVMLQNYLLGKIDNFYDDRLPEPEPTTTETIFTEPPITTTTQTIPLPVYGPPLAFEGE